MAQTKVRAVYSAIEALRETWKFGAAIGGNIAVTQDGRSAVTFSGTPGATTSITVAGMTTTGVPVPDNGQSALKSSVDTTGTFEGPVVGASSATPQNTKVYITADGTLTLTDTANVYWGRVNLPDGYVFRGTVIPVKIGVPA